MATRKGKDKTKLRQKQVASLKRRMEARDLQVGQVRVNPAGQEKMSEVLEEFVRPYVGENPEEHVLAKAAALGVLAWNTAVFGAEASDDLDRLLAKHMTGLSPERLAQTRHLLDDMIARKKAHFAGNRRIIVDCRVMRTSGGLGLVVVSSPDLAPDLERE